MLPERMKLALMYLEQLKWDQRPDYDHMRMLLSQDWQEPIAFGSIIIIENRELASHILYDPE